MNGFDVCRTLKEEDYFKEIPVIFITAAEEIESLINGFKAGGVDYVIKPFRKEELIMRIRTHFDLKITHDKLVATTITLMELNKVKDKLFSIIGHDLRSPIGSVKMVLEFMSKGIIDPTKDDVFKNTVNDLIKTTDGVFNLLDNLLSWAKLGSGNLDSIPENISLYEAVNSNINLWKTGISNSNISIVNTIDKSHIVFADLNILKTIIRNLFSNAMKFTPKGGTISFDSLLIDRFVQICISDTGKGMTKEIIDKVLDSTIYYTTQGVNNEQGSGLGIKLCKDFIEKSGGKIWIESEPGKGTSVFFTLLAPDPNVENSSSNLVW
jgi:two-component system, sensor histidine kinase and response regulator